MMMQPAGQQRSATGITNLLIHDAGSSSTPPPRLLQFKTMKPTKKKQAVIRTITRPLLTLAAITSLGIPNTVGAEESHIIRAGKLIKKELDWPDMDPAKNPFWKGWVHCRGKTIDGLYAVENRDKNHARFRGAKSALGDCEFKVVFSCDPGDSKKWNPNITIADRGALRFSDDGGKIWLETRKRSLPLKAFEAPCAAKVYDRKMHSMAVERVGNKISFYYDDKQVNEQEIDPYVNLYLWFDALGSAPKIRSIKLTAEKLSDKLETYSVAPLVMPAMFSDNAVLQRDMEVPVWGWARPAVAVQVSILGQTKKAKADKDGKWSVRLSPMKASTKPVTMRVTAGDVTKEVKNLLVGEVWICSGQSNMDRSVASCDIPTFVEPASPLIRRIHVPHARAPKPVGNFSGRWEICSGETVRTFMATSFYFGYHLHKELGVPVGIIDASWGGQRIEPFIPPEGFAQEKEIDVNNLTTPFPYWKLDHPSTLYHGMVCGVIPYGIRGAAWYQAESNGNEGDSYVHKMRALVKGWRQVWKQGEFPFYFVQLPNYQAPNNDPEGGDGWARVREAQSKVAATVKNTGLAVTIDIGEAGDIHPKNKYEVGKRLALWALAKDYGRQDAVFSGPVYRSMNAVGKLLELEFDHVGSGLIAARKSGPRSTATPTPVRKLDGFAIAGEDQEWHWADAIIKNNRVIVSSADVAEPVAVRYAFSMNPIRANLYNREGLPASPFRTDNWEIVRYTDHTLTKQVEK